jgi:tRNA threonylcarbamoyl adenosine modification protein YjeE
MEEYITNNPIETKIIAKKIFEKLEDNNLIFLKGELGVGKTTFVQGIGKSLNIQNITSPTFSVKNEYSNLIHYDLYMLDDKIASNIDSILLEDMEKGSVIIE